MIYIAVLGHLISDFVLQTDSMISRKKNNAAKGNLIHAAFAAGLTAALFLAFYFFYRQMDSAVGKDCATLFLYILVTHFIIDYIKYRLQRDGLMILLWDQAFHLTAIFLFFKYAGIVQIPLSQTVLLAVYMLIVIVCCVWAGDILIRQVLRKHEGARKSHEENINHTGSVIGRIERFIMLVFMLLGYQLGIITVFVIKSIIRFEEYRKGNNDYYILGNLLSLLVVAFSYVLWLLLSYHSLHADGSVLEVMSTSLLK